MTYRLLVFSEEVENFVVEIMASPTTTFHDLHALILQACNYTEDEKQAFFVCNTNWKIKEKIHLHEPAHTHLDEDLYLMRTTMLEDFLDDDSQHIAYSYTSNNKSVLIIECVENIFEKNTGKAYINRQKGTAPVQYESTEAESITPLSTPNTILAELGESSQEDYENCDTTDSDSFSEEDIDMEGYELTDL